MESILTKTSRSNRIGHTRQKESVETAGSLAMNQFHSLFEVNTYDEFYTNNPFSVDYSMYADYGDSVAYSGFLNSFSNAVSTLGAGCDFSGGASFSGGDCGFSSCSGGFTSVC